MEAASQRSRHRQANPGKPANPACPHPSFPPFLPPFISLGVDLERKKFRFLAPCPGALPSRYLVVGSVVWVEQHCSCECMLFLTTFGVLGIHARQQHHGPSSLIHVPRWAFLAQHSTYTPIHTEC